MCDTLCVITPGGTVFGKNSDRPPGEVQVVETYGRREPAGELRTQYLTIPDAPAAAVVGSRPEWLWGFEHGVNEHGVAIGNEKVYTVDDPYAFPNGLIGMDLVRLGLERGADADEACAVMTALLEQHGQGGVADASAAEPYFSSFLIADPRVAWVLETSGRTWAAKRVEDGAAISNRITLADDWDRASPEVAKGTGFDRWRHPHAPTGHADRRLAATRTCVASKASDAREVVAYLRHHGDRPWGAPGTTDVGPLPEAALPDGTGVTVCMHVRGYAATTSSMVASLPADPTTQPLRAWVALGSPCASVYVPVFPPYGVPRELADAESWKRFAALRDRVESDAGALAGVRAVLAPVEAALWDEADAAAGDPAKQAAYAGGAWSQVQAALDELS